MSTFGVHPVAQVAIAVPDIEVARHKWAALLGIEVPPIVETGPGAEARQRFRGTPSEGRVKLVFIEMGNLQIELVQPIEGSDTSWAQNLGLHHIAFWTDAMKPSADALESHGFELEQRGDMGEGQYAYFTSDPDFGVRIELLERKRHEDVGV